MSYSGQRGGSEEGLPGKTPAVAERMGHTVSRERAVQAEGWGSAKALMWACAWRVPGAVRRLLSLEQKDGDGSGHSKCPPVGVSDPGRAPGQTSPLWSHRNMSTQRDGHSFCQLVKLFSQPLRAPRRPVFCLQPERLSPEMSRSQQMRRHPSLGPQAAALPGTAQAALTGAI